MWVHTPSRDWQVSVRIRWIELEAGVVVQDLIVGQVSVNAKNDFVVQRNHRDGVLEV
jgi:hypothetical protein